MDTISRKMKPKTNRTSKKGSYVAIGADVCQTPPYALGPILPYLKKNWMIWEPAAGEGNITNTLRQHGNLVVPTDISYAQDTEAWVGLDKDFFLWEPGLWDAQVTNPPYSIKFKWLERSYELGKPFALLVPVDILGTKQAQVLFKQYGFEIMLLDTRVDFIMPNKGLSGAGAQFSTMWLCWNILPEKIMFGSISEAKAEFKRANKGRDILPSILDGLGHTPEENPAAGGTEDIEVSGQSEDSTFDAGSSSTLRLRFVDWLRQYGSGWL